MDRVLVLWWAGNLYVNRVLKVKKGWGHACESIVYPPEPIYICKLYEILFHSIVEGQDQAAGTLGSWSKIMYFCLYQKMHAVCVPKPHHVMCVYSDLVISYLCLYSLLTLCIKLMSSMRNRPIKAQYLLHII